MLEKAEEEAMLEELHQLVMKRDKLMWQFDEDKNRYYTVGGRGLVGWASQLMVNCYYSSSRFKSIILLVTFRDIESEQSINMAMTAGIK